MPKTAIHIRDVDQVATAIQDLAPGDLVTISGLRSGHVIEAKERIRAGHKIAVIDIAAGEEIRKYGEVIGAATEAVRQGEWVHVHNCRGMKGRRFDMPAPIEE